MSALIYLIRSGVLVRWKKDRETHFCIAYFYYKINALAINERCELVHYKKKEEICWIGAERKIQQTHHRVFVSLNNLNKFESY